MATTDPIKAAMVMNYADAGMSSNQISSIVDMPARTARDIIARHGRWGEIADRPVFAALRHQQKAILEAASRAISAKALARVEETLDKTSAYQAAGIYGLLRTHERLDAGEPTEIHASVNLHAVADLDKLASMLGQSLVVTPTVDITPEKQPTSDKQ